MRLVLIFVLLFWPCLCSDWPVCSSSLLIGASPPPLFPEHCVRSVGVAKRQQVQRHCVRRVAHRMYPLSSTLPPTLQWRASPAKQTITKPNAQRGEISPARETRPASSQEFLAQRIPHVISCTWAWSAAAIASYAAASASPFLPSLNLSMSSAWPPRHQGRSWRGAGRFL